MGKWSEEEEEEGGGLSRRGETARAICRRNKFFGNNADDLNDDNKVTWLDVSHAAQLSLAKSSNDNGYVRSRNTTILLVHDPIDAPRIRFEGRSFPPSFRP